MRSIHIILLYFVERIRCSNYHQIYVVVLLWLMFDIKYRLYLMYGIHTHLNATLVKTHCTVNAFIRKIKTTKMLILCCFVGWPHMSDSHACLISFHKNQSDYFSTKTDWQLLEWPFFKASYRLLPRLHARINFDKIDESKGLHAKILEWWKKLINFFVYRMAN